MKKVAALDKDRRYRAWTIQAWEEQRLQDAERAAAMAEKKHRQLRAQVLRAALARCEAMGDGDQARQQMHRDVRDTPGDLLQDLLAVLTPTEQNDRAQFEAQFDRDEWRRRGYQPPRQQPRRPSHERQTI